MNQVSLDLKAAPDVAELLAGKNPGDTVELTVVATIAEKDAERFVADIDEVVEVDGETLAAEDEAEDDETDDEKPFKIGKGKVPTDETDEDGE